ncbi:MULTISPECIES: hypothetical protein [Corynebacterium]|nr:MULTISPECIES: hypothetical protein [Corynebacterium]QNP92229.1 hypothetical protein IAU67_09630 [Corynebacterium zhongnanshanii]
MPLWLTAVVVFAGGSIGIANGLKKRMKNNPELQGKGLRALFSKNKP